MPRVKKYEKICTIQMVIRAAVGNDDKSQEMLGMAIILKKYFLK